MLEIQVIPSIDGAEISLSITSFVTPEIHQHLDITLNPSDWAKLCNEIIRSCKHPENGAGIAYTIEDAKLTPEQYPKLN